MKTQIFILEDDPIIKEALILILEANDYLIESSSSIKGAEDFLLNNKNTSLFLLDINLPDGSGVEFCKTIRLENQTAPVIFLTARADEESLLLGFGNGADDYMRKPFSNKELLARIRYQLSEAQVQEKIIKFNNVTLSISKHELRNESNTLSLSQKEFLILNSFFAHPGMVMTRENLLNILSPGDAILDRTIDTHISHLRSKLKKSNFNEFIISSVYGSGYKIEVAL